MSEEELDEYENAIANGKDIIKTFEFPEGSIAYYEMYSMINLIEKQQKEIEEYKRRLTPTPDNYVPIEYQTIMYVDKRNYISKDKIKAKIKEWDVNIKWANADDHYYAIKILKELLGEEDE